MTIDVVFDPPLPSDPPETFNSKAFATLGALNTWSGEANALASSVNADVTDPGVVAVGADLIGADTIGTVASVAASVSTVASIAPDVTAVAAIDSSVVAVAANAANINAAVADLPSLAAKVSKTGDTMTGPLEVPAGATGAQVPQAQEVAPPGLVAMFARNTAPTGWLKSNGANVSRTTYADLFAAIGTTFGVGDGSTTFGLPDMRAEFARGWDDGRGIDTGRSFGSYQADDFKSHNHTQNASVSSTAGSLGTGSANAANDRSGGNTSVSGGTETRPRNIALLACIKY